LVRILEVEVAGLILVRGSFLELAVVQRG